MEKVNVSKLEVDIAGKTAVLESGGGGSTPAPNSVNSETIQDHSIKEEDLDHTILDKLDSLDEENVVTEEEIEECWSEAMRNAGLDL